MQDPKETFNNIEQNTEMALLQSEKIAESVDNLEPIMEGVLLKTDEMVQEMKKNNDKPINETRIIFEGVEMTEVRGRDGKDGKDGARGEKGDKGDTGEKGDKGDKGDRGEKGIDGIDGYNGRDGLDGLNGMPGLPGKAGRDGKDGKNGRDGKDGTTIKPEEIKKKLESLKVGLDYDSLSNVPDIVKIARMSSSKTVSLTELDDVDYSGLTQTNGKYVLGGSGLTSVEHDSTLTGDGTTGSPLSVVATSASDVAVTVRAATTAALAGTWTYNNGTSGVGATLTRTTNGALPNQDGVSLMDGDRFLIKNQASTLVNGVYVLTQKGVTSVSPTIFTRATDADETSELDELVVTVSEGSTNRGTVWGQQTNNPVVGTSAIVFATVVSTAVTQATSGTQVINQIPLYTGTARQLTRGTANFKYNPTNDLFTIRGIDYTFPANNGDASQVLTTDGAGTLSWAAGGGGGVSDGDYGDITVSGTGSIWTVDNSAITYAKIQNIAQYYGIGRIVAGTGVTTAVPILSIDTTDSNIFSGAISAGVALTATSGIRNNLLGFEAGSTLTTGNNNNFLGYQAGKGPTTGVTHSNFIGYQTGLNATSATNSNFFGRQAGSGATSASFANFFGRSAGLNATGAQYGIFIGDNAGNAASGSSNGVFIGQNAGYQATTAPYSIFIGTSAGYQASGAITATFIGYAAGYTASNADYSNFIGRGAGNAATNAFYSQFMGFQAGYNATNAANAIFIGSNAGFGDTVDNTVSGTSILIGNDTSTGGFSNSIAIGKSATNTAANEMQIGSASSKINTVVINGIGGIQVPVGTTGERVAVQGMIRYNTTTSKFEGYDGAVWQDFY